MRLAVVLLRTLAPLGFASAALAAAAVELAPVPGPAQRRLASVRVQVAPDRADWTYAPGEPVAFRIQVLADGHPVPGAVATYTVAPENTRADKVTASVPAAGLVVSAGAMRTPGFLRCIVETEVGGRTYRGLATAACAPEQIRPGQGEPADFDAFWDRSKAQLARVPLEPVLTLLPDACTDRLNVYHVSFRTLGADASRAARLYGILCEPKAPGRYPALLRLPGAGVRPYAGDKATAELGFITLEIGIHGLPVNLPPEVYERLQAGALNNYWRFNLDDRDAYYFRRVYLGCLRANDLLTSRPAWDGRNLIAAGASQGGQLAIVTAALDPRVTALLAVHPGLCDLTPERLHFRATGEPLPYSAEKLAQSPHATPAKRATIAYYDTVNFARRVRVPGCYLWGYNDEVCTPSSLYAAFNVIAAPKTLELMLEQGHSYPPEQWDALQRWLTGHVTRP
ncbi:acetylxylan esterase [Oleiharenicola sp. Vm1]|uniref:acetylxylan esterase n=1 Tax=Oleiharenicola sp. Vm1 TaxID=3398393 RepID=UPI0039F63E78